VIDVDARPQKRIKLSNEDDKCLWLQFNGINLTVSDKNIVIEGLELHDMHINVYQMLLKKRFQSLNGLSSTLNVAAIGKLG